ncbi:MAG: hypothetical protein WCO78_04285 [Candidatus Roizmanbacteria bacterium]
MLEQDHASQDRATPDARPIQPPKKGASMFSFQSLARLSGAAYLALLTACSSPTVDAKPTPTPPRPAPIASQIPTAVLRSEPTRFPPTKESIAQLDTLNKFIANTFEELKKKYPEAESILLQAGVSIPGGEFGFCSISTNGVETRKTLFVDTAKIVASPLIEMKPMEAVAAVTRHEFYHCLGGIGTYPYRVAYTDPETRKPVVVSKPVTSGFAVIDSQTDRTKPRRVYSMFEESYAHWMAGIEGFAKPGINNSLSQTEVGAQILQLLSKKGIFPREKVLGFHKKGDVASALNLLSPNRQLTASQLEDILIVFSYLEDTDYTNPNAVAQKAEQILAIVSR